MRPISPTSRILIFGLAREGISTLKFLRSHGVTAKIYVADDKPIEKLEEFAQQVLTSDSNTHFLSGKELDDSPDMQFDVIFLTPGTRLNRLPSRLWPIVTSQTALFLENYSSQTVGITGTKGKSTVSSLLYEILKTDGKDAVLLGNIGLPPLDYFDKIQKNTIVVFELSSHQLSLVKNSPHIAAVLNFFPEHLDYYKSLEVYADAKFNIAKFQTEKDLIFFDPVTLAPILSQKLAKSKSNQHPIVKEEIEEVSHWPTPLVGQFNRTNIAFAWQIAKSLKVSEKSAQQAVKSFQPLEHRLELVGTFKNLMFFNDSLATIPEATIEALNTFGDQVETLLVGGFDRGVDQTPIIQKIADSQIKNLILFPTTGSQIGQGVKGLRPVNSVEVDSMEQAVEKAYELTSPGKIVLLSSAATSFNLFKDYRDRGEQFKEWVAKLGKNS